MSRASSMAPQRLLLALSALLLTAAPAAAQNLILNPGFDDDLSGWRSQTAAWSALDAGGDPGSGSALGANSHDSGGTLGVTALSQCVAVDAGQSYEYGMRTLLPAGQEHSGYAYFHAVWSPTFPCDGAPIRFAPGDQSPTAGAWAPLGNQDVAPAGAKGLTLILGIAKQGPGGTLQAHFDDAFVCRLGECDRAAGPWITSPLYPDFRFRVTFTTGGQTIPGQAEPDCLPETVCVSGALPGRSELFLRILGPRPNGYLWPTIVRFTPSQVEVEIEQLSRQLTKVYELPAVPPGVDDLAGLQDRTGFLP